MSKTVNLEDVIKLIYLHHNGTDLSPSKILLDDLQSLPSESKEGWIEAIADERIRCADMAFDYMRSFNKKSDSSQPQSMRMVVNNECADTCRILANSILGRNGLNADIDVRELVIKNIKSTK